MNISKKANIGVLLGGLSREREVSLKSGRALARALRECGYEHVKEIDVTHNVFKDLSKENLEAALIALHGRYGEDGTIQGVLEFLRIPYTGTGVSGSALAMDKVSSKRLFRDNHIPTPPWIETDRNWDEAQIQKEIENNVGFPVVAKPVHEGSTIGLTVVETKDQVRDGHEKALQYDELVIWEKYIRGHELTVGFLNNDYLPVVEIVPRKGLFDYEAKYTKGMTEYYCPARISEEVARQTQEEALKAFQVVRAQSFGRVDLIYSKGTPVDSRGEYNSGDDGNQLASQGSSGCGQIV